MCLKEDVLSALSRNKQSGHQIVHVTMKASKLGVTEARVIEILREYVESGDVREYTETGRRDGAPAKERLLCTPPAYHLFQLSRLGFDKQKLLIIRRRAEESRMQRKWTRSS